MRKLIFLLIYLLMFSATHAQNINKININGPMNLQVNSFNGNLFFSRLDFGIPYRSLDMDMLFNYNSFDYAVQTGFGKGWRFNFSMNYVKQGNVYIVTWNDGREESYKIDTVNAGTIRPDVGIFNKWIEQPAGVFKLITKDRTIYFFEDSVHKRMTKIQDRNGNNLTFTYSDSLLTGIQDGAGRSIQFVYTGPLMTQIIDANGTARSFNYQYDGYGNLKMVTDPNGNSWKYDYLINGPLSKVTDRNGNAVDIIYHSNFTVKELISCISRKSISYNRTLKTTHVVDHMDSGNNQVTKYVYNELGYLIRMEGNCCGYQVSFEYDAMGNIVKKTDANGKNHHFSYDNKGNMLTATDPNGNADAFTYDTVFNKVLTHIDKNGNLITYSYDLKGNLVGITKPLGIAETFGYASNGDLISYTDPKNHTTTFSYDNYGNLISVARPLGVLTTFAYDLKSRMASITDPLGHQTVFTYDALNRLITKKNALNNTTTTTYDANGNRISITDVNGKSSSFSYDAMDRLIAITNAMGKSKYFSYDEQGNVIAMKDENGNSTIYSYDNLNRVSSIKNALNEIKQFAYDGNGNLITMSMPNGNTVTFAYDDLNRLIAISDNLGLLEQYSYDKNDNKLTSTDGVGNTKSFSYDALNRLKSVTDAMGNSILLSYDANSNHTIKTDRKGNSRTYGYDALNRLISFTDPLSHTTLLSYDNSSNLVGITDAKSQSTTFGFDALNRNISETLADGTTKLFTYDNIGNVLSKQDGNGNLISYSYDDMYRLVGINYPGSNDNTFTYDFVGNMISAVNQNATVAFSYDASNALISESINGKVTGYSYQTANGIRNTIYPGGRTIMKSYDARGRLVSVSDGNSLIARFNYDVSNRMISSSYSNGTSTNISYDANDRVVSMLSNPSSFLNLNYAYDNEDNKLSEEKVHKPASSEHYIYDNSNRLTGFKRGNLIGSVVPNPVENIQYNYDQVGNRININSNNVITNYTVNNVNNYTQINNGAIVLPTYDANGNLLNDGIHTLAYDFENRMMLVDGGNTAMYFYDALGRRIKRVTSTDTINYYFDSFSVIEERNNSDQTLATYTYGSWMDDILTMKRGSQDYFYHYNNLGSVYAITTAIGNVAESYQYEAFGAFDVFDAYNAIIPNTGIGNQYSFTGRDFNTESGRFNFRSRTYSSLSGRFEQRDPIGLTGGLNLYNYVFNNPTNYIDPNGSRAISYQTGRSISPVQMNMNSTRSIEFPLSGLPSPAPHPTPAPFYPPFHPNWPGPPFSSTYNPYASAYADNYIGPGDPLNLDPYKWPLGKSPKNLIDACAQFHDYEYYKVGAIGIIGVLTNDGVIAPDERLVKCAQGVIKTCNSKDNLDPFTREPLSLTTCMKAWAVENMFKNIVPTCRAALRSEYDHHFTPPY